MCEMPTALQVSKEAVQNDSWNLRPRGKEMSFREEEMLILNVSSVFHSFLALSLPSQVLFPYSSKAFLPSFLSPRPSFPPFNSSFPLSSTFPLTVSSWIPSIILNLGDGAPLGHGRALSGW